MYKNEEIFVSYIVPVYNVEKYIVKCVNSIINQKYRNLEIILVDDGSTDSSGYLIDELKKKDQRIKAFHQDNKGVSYARNTGLNNSNGEYILFIDGDDYIEPDYTSYFIHLVLDNLCEMGVSINCFNLRNQTQVSTDNVRKIQAEQAIEDIYLEKINVAVWNKIYKRSFLIENNIYFNTDIWFGEGMLFNIECLQYIDYVAIGERRVYHQFYNLNSAMRNFNLESNYCGIRSLELQKELWKKKSNKIRKSWEYHYRCFSLSILNGLIKTNSVEKYKKEYEQCINTLKGNLLLPLTVNISLRQKLVFVIASICPNLLVKRSIWKEEQRLKRYNRSEI